MPNTLTVSTDESAGIISGMVTVLARPITGKVLGMLLNGTWDLPIPMVQDAFGESHKITDFAPFSPGQVVGVREGWKLIGWDWEDPTVFIQYGNGDVENKERFTEDYDGPDDWLCKEIDRIAKVKGVTSKGFGDNKEFVWDTTDILPWRPASQMPPWAIRTHIQILTVTAKPVREITEAEMIKAGYKPIYVKDKRTIVCSPEGKIKFREDWQSRHPKRPFDTSWAWVMTIRKEER